MRNINDEIDTPIRKLSLTLDLLTIKSSGSFINNTYVIQGIEYELDDIITNHQISLNIKS